MPGKHHPYDGARLERLSFSALTDLILCASGPALDAVEAFVVDLQQANELAPDAICPEAVRFALSRIANLRGTIAYRRLELAAARIEAEVERLSAVAEVHRGIMLRELGDSDTAKQRGNAGAYCYVDGVIDGLLNALREIGFDDRSAAIAHERDAVERIGPQLSGVAGQRP